MVSVTATEFIKSFGRLNFEAQREPIAVTNHGHVTGYYISSHEYEELQKIKATMRNSYTINTMPEELYQEIITSRVNPAFSNLDSLLDDNTNTFNNAR